MVLDLQQSSIHTILSQLGEKPKVQFYCVKSFIKICFLNKITQNRYTSLAVFYNKFKFEEKRPQGSESPAAPKFQVFG